MINANVNNGFQVILKRSTPDLSCDESGASKVV